MTTFHHRLARDHRHPARDTEAAQSIVRTPMLGVVAARAAAVVMLGIAAFQVALVFGAPWGEYTQGGPTEGALDVSGRSLAAVSCAILLVMAAAMLARVREGPLKSAPGKLVTGLCWFTTVYSGLSIALNLVTDSSSERVVFAPTAILLFLLVVTTMVSATTGIIEPCVPAHRARRGTRGMTRERDFRDL